MGVILVPKFMEIPHSAKFPTIFRFQDALFSPSVEIGKKLCHIKTLNSLYFARFYEFDSSIVYFWSRTVSFC